MRVPKSIRNTVGIAPACVVLLVLSVYAAIASSQDACSEVMHCGERFAFDRRCVVIADDQYMYPFEVNCAIFDRNEPLLAILESTTVRGKLVTSANALARLVGLQTGEHCEQQFFEIHELEVRLTLLGNSGNPMVVEGEMSPSWCVRFDGRQLSVTSMNVHYSLDSAPPLIESILNNDSVREAIDEKVSEMVVGVSIDIIALLNVSQ